MDLTVETAWPELREHLDRTPHAVVDTWRRRVEMLYESGQLEPLWREVSNPLFIADVWDHAPLAEQALRVLGALAWHTPHVAAVRRSFDDRVRHFGLEALADDVDDEIDLAARTYAVQAEGERLRAVPDALARVFARHPLMMPAARVRAWRDLAREYPERDDLLALCARIASHDHTLATTLAARLVDEAPRERQAFASLPPDVAAPLADALAAIGRRSFRERLRDLFGGVADGVGVGRLYGYQAVRHGVAKVLAEVGVPLLVAVDCLAHDRRLKKLARHQWELRNDPGLLLYGVLVAGLHATTRVAGAPTPGAPYR